MNLLIRLWRDEFGGINSAEYVMIATLLVIGIVPGLATTRDAVVTELADFAAAVSNLFPTPTVIPTGAPWACITIESISGPVGGPDGG